MRIENSSLTLAGTHQAHAERQLEMSSRWQFRQVLASAGAGPVSDGRSERLQQGVRRLLDSLVDAILAAIRGKSCLEKVADSSLPEAASGTPEAAQRGQWFSEQRILIHEKEYESTAVSAHGSVSTADGREIDFSCCIHLQRSEERTLLASQEEIVLSDPLMLNFDGAACALSGQRFAFDLKGEGCLVEMPGAAAGSAYLVFDRNGNGRADDGTELFGVRSGDGFADLARLDADGNGWVDEGDAAFGQLAVWQGEHWQRLAEAGVGALSTGKVDSPFTLKDGTEGLLGQIRASGVYLRENGTAGFMQQVDVSLAAPAGDKQPGQRQELPGENDVESGLERGFRRSASAAQIVGEEPKPPLQAEGTGKDEQVESRVRAP